MTHPAHSGDPEDAADDALCMVPAAIKLLRILGTNPAPRMLTPYEVDLLRQSEREIVVVVRGLMREGGVRRARIRAAAPGQIGPQAVSSTC